MKAMQNTVSKPKVLDRDFLFIVGSPRSGTTWLRLMMGAHPSVCTTTELRLYNKYLAPWLESWRQESLMTEEGKHYTGLPVLWSQEEFYEFLKGFLERVYAKALAVKPAATHILDKHPGYSEFVEDINFFIPHARFIHVIRDGRDVAVSLLAASRQMGWFERASLPDYGVTWKQNLLAARKAQAYAERYLEVRYEDLSVSPVSTLESVFRFCGLPATQGLVTSIVESHRFDKLKRLRPTAAPGVRAPQGHYREGKVGTWRREFTAAQRYRFDQIAGDLLCELGYAQKGWWAGNLSQRLRVPLLAAAHNGWRRAVYIGSRLFGSKHGWQLR